MNLTLLIINGLIIASMYALSKFAMAHDIAPLTVMLWQVIPSAMLLYAAAWIRGERPQFSPQLLRYYIIAGLLGLTIPYAITYQALQHLPAGVIGVAGSLSAVMTYAIARVWGFEKPGLRRVAGLLLGLAGVLAIILPKQALPAPGMTAWVVVALLAPLSLAAGNVYRTAGWPAGGKPLAMAAGMLVTQGLVIVLATLATGSEVLPAIDGSRTGAAIAALGILSTVFYTTAFELQRRVAPVFISQMGYVISVGSLLIGMVFLGERPSIWIWVAVVAIAAGIAMVVHSPSAPLPAKARDRITAPRRTTRK
jgi:drug/metabolite transporter (DMT)-like permease